MGGWNATILLDEVTPKLRGWTQRMRSEVCAEVDVVGANMKDLAWNIAPVRSGFLRSTIYYEVQKELLTLEFGARAYYAYFVERGTAHMAARSFLRPAMSAHEQQLLDAILLGCMKALG
jgi:HK97 gp10 family phage protein